MFTHNHCFINGAACPYSLPFPYIGTDLRLKHHARDKETIKWNPDGIEEDTVKLGENCPNAIGSVFAQYIVQLLFTVSNILDKYTLFTCRIISILLLLINMYMYCYKIACIMPLKLKK